MGNSLPNNPVTQDDPHPRYLVQVESHPRYSPETIQAIVNSYPQGYHLHSTQVLFVPNELNIAVIYIFEKDA